MSKFDGLIGNWIQVVDVENNLTIENYDYDTGIIEGTTDNHCIKCVAVNQCYFKNEQGKKPEGYIIVKNKTIKDITEWILGLYHPYCHCVENSTNIENIEDIELIVPLGKIDWLFLDKSEWIKSFGHQPNNSFLEILYTKIKEAYFYGAYEIQSHTKYGVKINLNIRIEGKGIKAGKIYNLKSSFMIFPNKKLKCNTLIGGWTK